MSSHHLKDLRAALERNHWIVVEELPGNDMSVSAVWRVARPNGAHSCHLEFGGIDDLRVRPLEEAYGVSVREAQEIGAYFARVGRTWPVELERFIERLNRWADRA
jgi:hypothetical protein